VLDDLNSTNLADDSVTIEKLAPQVRADLNKTASRPFGATLANPYGILGTPIVHTSTSYTVPGGKTLVMTSNGYNVEVGGKNIKSTNSPPAILPSGTTVTQSFNYGWSGYLLEALSGITPIVHTSTSYTVPGGKTLVITSNGYIVEVSGKSIRSTNSPPSILPSGTTVTNSSNYGWSGYLLDPTQFE
jgi:3D (Asp-Asp-Asp) domain-containing protein